GWVSFDAAAAACLRALRRPTAGHATYHIVADRTMAEEPSAELAMRWYPEVPMRSDLPGHAGFYSTVRASAELGWDAGHTHPEIGSGER
ncbi:MAG: hypothetical protein ACRDQ0_14120, partial [Pseudonocardia sp.]